MILVVDMEQIQGAPGEMQRMGVRDGKDSGGGVRECGMWVEFVEWGVGVASAKKQVLEEI